ncbi:hypothetical protein ATANTOWER_016170 [Ataeniobius toweri]|uniref:Uncharacterized protein n=1 Tax=Ataeniobius toweri TaxID=208326 RepID=A0ABU7B8B5_9TELE|nr:hypothetical protein [Ataeniobius toweri]
MGQLFSRYCYDGEISSQDACDQPENDESMGCTHHLLGSSLILQQLKPILPGSTSFSLIQLPLHRLAVPPVPVPVPYHIPEQ